MHLDAKRKSIDTTQEMPHQRPCLRMKRTKLLLVACLGASAALAQDEENRPPPAPVENLFFATDEMIYIPKNTFSFGFRALSGSKTSFSGKGYVYSDAVSIGDATGANQQRTYHDGSVSPDARTGTDGSALNGIDGKTNTWSYSSSLQQQDGGRIAMHSYTADVLASTNRKADGTNAYGIELTTSRDMGKLTTKFQWNLVAGLSLNDLKSKAQSAELARIKTITDLYSLDGAAFPDAPYSAPSSTTETVKGPNGETVYTDPPNNTTAETRTVDTSVLLGNEPVNRSETEKVVEGAVVNNWKMKGAYYTFRAGPTLAYSFTEKLKASFSAGAAMVYAGSTFTIQQEFTPDTGETINNTVSDSKSRVMAGYFADANVEYWMTERAGFFAGAVFQSSGSYKQSVKSDNVDYQSKVDLNNLSGLRAGMNIRF